VATSADLLRGTSEGVYVSLSGVVTAGPELTNRLASTPAQIWSLVSAADGTIWAGTGGDGRIIRVRPGQAEETAFDTNENNVFALAVSGPRVFAATGPDGKVYVLEPNAEPRVFFDPEERYVWALAVDAGGRLWVGAGNPAVVYRVDAKGASTVVYRAPAGHVVTLAPDGGGRMLAGTASPGRLYRFDAEDRPFVVLDSGLAELRAVAPYPNGTIYAAAVAEADGGSGGGEPASVAVTLTAAKPAAAGASVSSDSSSEAGSDTSAPPRRSALFRIDPSGTWEAVWNAPDVIYDIAARDDGVLVATGPSGRLYKVDQNRDISLLTGVDAKQITRFTRGTGSVAAFATANPGRVMVMGSGVQSPATYLSSVRDTQSAATWGLIRWEASGSVALATRSGNTDTPDDSWSPWSQPYTQHEGEPITSPPARFLQWRAVFTKPSGAGTPTSLTAVTVAYLTANNRPVVTSVTVHPPGVVFQRPFSNEEGAIAGLDEATADARRPPGDTGPPTPAPGRRMFQRGLQTIAWRAEDGDAGDRLTYTIEYRREGSETWRTLRSDLSDSIFVWDTTSAVDGRYVVRVKASDSPSNAADRALVGEREADPIEVDNTPPAISAEVIRQGNQSRLAIRVVDGRTPIQKVEFAVDGGAWQLLYPVDGLSDAPEERYELPLSADTDPARIVIRATDLLQNTSSVPAVRP
jgi:sugar lactone lactonase YvrE